MKKNLFKSQFLQGRIDDWVKEHGRPPVFLLKVVEKPSQHPYVEVREGKNPDEVIEIDIGDLLIHYWVTEYGTSEPDSQLRGRGWG